MTDKRISVRREPPRFRRVSLQSQSPLGAGMVRAILSGPDLEGFEIAEPAASVRVLLPTATGLVIPEWNGNEFLYSDGSRPRIRTFTPRRFAKNELTIDVVVHDGGATSEWLSTASDGDELAVSGPGRGYRIDEGAPAFLLVGDETAIPAISQLLEFLPETIPVEVIVEVRHSGEVPTLPDHPNASANWLRCAGTAPPGDELVRAVEQAAIADDTRIWCAGEAAAMHRIRNHLFKERQLPRAQATVRGYWKARN